MNCCSVSADRSDSISFQNRWKRRNRTVAIATRQLFQSQLVGSDWIFSWNQLHFSLIWQLAYPSRYHQRSSPFYHKNNKQPVSRSTSPLLPLPPLPHLPPLSPLPSLFHSDSYSISFDWFGAGKDGGCYPLRIQKLILSRAQWFIHLFHRVGFTFRSGCVYQLFVFISRFDLSSFFVGLLGAVVVVGFVFGSFCGLTWKMLALGKCFHSGVEYSTLLSRQPQQRPLGCRDKSGRDTDSHPVLSCLISLN